MRPHDGLVSGCLSIVIAGGCAARPLDVPVAGTIEEAWTAPGCPYLTPWLDGEVLRFSVDGENTLVSWRAVLTEELPGGRERRMWTLSRRATLVMTRYEEITVDGCGLASWRGQDERSNVTLGPYVPEIPAHPIGVGEIEQADGSRAAYRFQPRASFEDAGARYLDCFEIEVMGEQIAPRRFQDRTDVYCRDIGLVYRAIDGEIARRQDDNPS